MISALSECFLVNLEQEKKEEAAKGKKNILGDIKEGFKYLWREYPKVCVNLQTDVR